MIEQSMPKWSPKEDEEARAAVAAHVPIEEIARRLSRTYHSVANRLSKLNVWQRKRWTAKDDAVLIRLWNEGEFLVEICRRLGRNPEHPEGVCRRARVLGLPSSVPPGHEFVTRAARRTGYCVETLWRIIQWAGVVTRPVRTPHPGRRVGHRKYYVDPYDVDVAIERWMKAESPTEGAARWGISPTTLAKWLVDAGICTPCVPGKRHVWHIDAAVIDKVVLARRPEKKLAGIALRNRLRVQRRLRGKLQACNKLAAASTLFT